MGLKEYRARRDFRISPEPRGRVTPKAGSLQFVIQKHAASRLHYDFRLEAEGVLKSWAVPKGPSLDPKERRLAVEVEDHPLEYGSFEGIIPEGEYGGGTVLLWDNGQWFPEGDPVQAIRKGSLKFRLEGQKLHGRWVLVRMRTDDEGKNNWLLIKEKDDAARPLAKGDITEERPESVTTGRTIDEIAAESDAVWNSNREPRPRSSGSGFKARIAAAARATAAGNGGGRRPAPSARGARGAAAAARHEPPKRPTKARVAASVPDLDTIPGARKARLPKSLRPELATLVKEAPAGDGWLHEIKFDGFRILCFVEKGEVRFITRNGKDWTERFEPLPRAVQSLPVDSAVLDGEVVVLVDNRSSFQALQNVLSGSGDRGLFLYLFDLLYLDGYDLSGTTLETRKSLLASLLQDAPPAIRYSDHVAGGGEAFFREACRLQVEGIVSKRRDSLYAAGRARDWLKVKCVNRQEFVIGGFTEPSGSRAGLGALMVGVYEGDELRFSGKVGTGFNTQLLTSLRRRLEKIEQKTPPFSNAPRGAAVRGVHWVRPELVAEVEFTEWTDEGLLRHPSFQGLREDKSPKEVHREVPAEGGAPASSRGALTSSSDGVEVAGVRLTNPERVLFPEQGLTKRDMAEYYASVAEWMLPHVIGRPLTIVRCPEGRSKPCFYQKHVGQGVPDSVDSVGVRESDGKIGQYRVVNNTAGLIGLVQMGVLEAHTWGARQDELEKPDRLVFDLDPDEGLPWERVVEGAFRVRRLLEELGLRSWVKDTGGKGLHVVAPITRRFEWDLVKEFCHAVAQRIVAEEPTRYTGIASKARRKGKVYVDYLRNARGATFIAPFSTRARDGAPVSTPLDWSELGPRQQRFTVATLPARLAGLKADPWKDLLGTRQSITQSMVRKLAG